MKPSLLLRSSALFASLALVACSTQTLAADAKAGGSGHAKEATVVHLGTRLSAEAEVPPNDSTGEGEVDVTVNTKTGQIKWKITYTGLSGEVSAGHFHGPAMPGENAGPVLSFSGSLASPIEGEAKLSMQQVDDLVSGRWYVNLHTAAHTGGEVRGQIGKGM